MNGAWNYICTYRSVAITATCPRPFISDGPGTRTWHEAAQGEILTPWKKIRGHSGRYDLYRQRNPVRARFGADCRDHGTCAEGVSCGGRRGDLHGGEPWNRDRGETHRLQAGRDQSELWASIHGNDRAKSFSVGSHTLGGIPWKLPSGPGVRVHEHQYRPYVSVAGTDPRESWKDTLKQVTDLNPRTIYLGVQPDH